MNKLQTEMIMFVRSVLHLSASCLVKCTPLEGRGSDREFYRLTWDDGHSAILIHYDPRRLENGYWGDLALFLKGIDIPVPELFGHDPNLCLLLLEDLGDMDLWSCRHTPWEKRRVLYRQTLDIARRLHAFPEADFPSRLPLCEAFGPELYSREREYFYQHFVQDRCGITLGPSRKGGLEKELSALAQRLTRTRRSLIHRDLQSQNVMIKDGRPRLIDFQGMRWGSPFYDLGSLLCDPYVDFSPAERLELLSHYYAMGTMDVSWPDFQELFWAASVQRLLQALGAYGFLGLKKGLKRFLDYIPAGLANLLSASSFLPTLNELPQLLRECEKRLNCRECRP